MHIKQKQKRPSVDPVERKHYQVTCCMSPFPSPPSFALPRSCRPGNSGLKLASISHSQENCLAPPRHSVCAIIDVIRLEGRTGGISRGKTGLRCEPVESRRCVWSIGQLGGTVFVQRAIQMRIYMINNMCSLLLCKALFSFVLHLILDIKDGRRKPLQRLCPYSPG